MVKQVLLISLLWINALSVVAQFKNIKLDDESAGNSVSEPSIIINPKNVKNIVAASDPDNIYYSNDGGLTWEKTKITSPNGVYGESVLIADDKGAIYSFHISAPSGEGLKNEKSLDQILCHTSKDGGKTWEEAAPLGFNQSKDQKKPWATVDSKGNLVVAWTQFDKYMSHDSLCQSNILFAGSSNGKKWSKPIQLSQVPGGCSDDNDTPSRPVVAAGPDGKIFTAWSAQNKIRMDRSFDGGGMWLENDIPIATQSGGWDLKIPGHDRTSGMPVLMVDKTKGTYKGVLYVAWADQRSRENDTDVWFMRSYNHGDNWSSPIKMGDDKGGKHQYLPAMAVDQVTGYIYVVYYDRSNYDDNQTDVYLAYSDDSGANFKSVKISESPFTPVETTFFGNYIGIAAHNGIITPVWVRMDDSKRSIWTTVIKESDVITPKAEPEKGKKKR
ncbi:MAG: glycosyl hydrolase [Marivirga sp.]|nr:glycosyl hydrolase [Marivirga sp.]